MPTDTTRQMMTARMVDSLYVESMLLADEARSYFDGVADREAASLPPITRVALSCESLKVTTRLMHVIAWLLTRKAIAAGEIAAPDGRRLGQASSSDEVTLETLPDTACGLIRASIDLYERVEIIDQAMLQADMPSPARGLIERLERAL